VIESKIYKLEKYRYRYIYRMVYNLYDNKNLKLFKNAGFRIYLNLTVFFVSMETETFMLVIATCHSQFDDRILTLIYFHSFQDNFHLIRLICTE